MAARRTSHYPEARLWSREEGEAWRERWFADQNWRPLPHQKQAWDAIQNQASGLLELPTGSGKTYAVLFGFLPQLGDGRRGLRLLYISPLKALARDVEHALHKPCADLGLHLRVETRTGDTTAARRRQQKLQLPEILITTPESLALLLTQDNSASLFSELQGIIIDEWHELLSSKRGSLLELCLSRVRSLASGARTWALSATLPNHEEAALAACGVGSQPLLITGLPPRNIQMRTLLPGPEDRLPGAGHIGLRMLPQVATFLDPAFSTLIFTNTRSQAERWHEGQLMIRPELEDRIALHHGSLDPKTREQVEHGVKEGQIRFVVCTSSLDLGVDFPEVDRVVQIGTPKSISRLIQRAGRSAHAPGKDSELLFVPTHNLELLEIAACRRALQAGFIEPRTPREQPLDVLIQHVVSCAMGGGFQADALYQEVCTAYGFRQLTRETFDWVLRFVVEGGDVLKAYPQYCRVVLESETFVVKDRSIMQRHRQNIGTILSDSSMIVKMGRRTLGMIEENFAARLRKGNRFLYAGRWMEVVSIADLTIYTRLSKKAGNGLIPTWLGQKLPWSPLLSTFMREVVEQLAYGSDLSDDPELSVLSAVCQAQKKISLWPHAGEILAEITGSREGEHFFIFPFEGQAVHESLGMLLVYRMSRLLAATFSLASNDYGLEIVSSIPLHWERDLVHGLLTTENMYQDLEAALNQTELARHKFRGIARVAGLVHQNLPGRRHSNRQVQSSSGLLFDVLKRFDTGNLLVRQAEVEVMEDQFNCAGLQRVLLKLQSTPIRFQTTRNFSPLAFPLYVERVSAQISSEQLADRIERIKNSWKQPSGKSAAKSSRSSPKKPSTGLGAEL
ncbi:MAG TPA: ligase-associated DNA damage response DEXH box helicase [Oligoflexus sp.]|uniref:ligase-associated DNA damage response DEXH box helicase n=1 Tax=Oligoflexus sp. TaxID=1971216 RepID=UPI002D34431A|nr:ligase-associated DNA damage response DEXH box helicase [Oligoflexus sp.]HYX34214.1 ligase-associated DNA damage response DEXH box helicase [Oligoflexus sp.]